MDLSLEFRMPTSVEGGFQVEHAEHLHAVACPCVCFSFSSSGSTPRSAKRGNAQDADFGFRYECEQAYSLEARGEHRFREIRLEGTLERGRAGSLSVKRDSRVR
jgi:hypothetical protein